MAHFFATAFSFPVALLSVLLVVVLCYWVLIVLGVADVDSLHFDLGFGLGGTKAVISASILIAISWFTCLGGAVLLEGWELSTALYILIGFLLLVVALLVGLIVTRILITPIRKLLPEDGGDSRLDFVGRTCVVRTTRVTQTFGQAEVAADDGSTAVVQVRQPGQDPLTAGDTAVIFDYDAVGEFFWVAPLTTHSLGDH
ncbi:hypothetical protein [Actinosynnema sp. NPDC020468]|uniref:hypothetical protein n=1 Tax=Actinosynnema sp. NPDC020468 TaxID=3154488 RepID=UPI0033F36167